MAFRCVIVTPEEQALDESATQAIVPAWDGQLGILSNRSPILVKLGMGTLRVDVQGGRRRNFFIDGGIAQMKDNRLTILTNEASAAEDIDVESARAEYNEASARVASDPKGREDRTRQMQRARLRQETAAAK